ncbi:hypothetical protein [Micromonospora chersina]
MNEIALLRAYGPEAPPPSPLVLEAARSRLVAELSAPAHRRSVVPARRRTLLVAAAAVLLAGAGTHVLMRPEPSATRGRITLAAAAIPEFPLALRPRPADLAAPSFSYGPGQFLAVYLARDGLSDVYLSVHDRRPAPGLGVPRPVTVAGHPGVLYDVRLPDNPHTVELVWERAPGQWVSLVGNGTRADPEAVLSLAAALVNQPQPVPLRVRLAPEGWKLAFFKDGTILTLQGDERDETLSVQVVDRLEPDLMHTVTGAQQQRWVSVGGRDAHLIRTTDGWFLQFQAPGGAVVNLQAPRRLDADQVVAIAEQVWVVRDR